MTNRRHNLARASAVEEIIRARHGDCDHVEYMVRRARTAILAGESAHRALTLAEEVVTVLRANPISTLREHAHCIAGTRVLRAEDVTTDPTGRVEATVFSYHLGRPIHVRLWLDDALAEVVPIREVEEA